MKPGLTLTRTVHDTVKRNTHVSMLSTYSKSDAIRLKLQREGSSGRGGSPQLFFFLTVEMGQRSRMRFLSMLLLLQRLVSASGCFLQIDRVSIVNVLGKVKMRAKDEAGSSEVAEEA